MGKEFMLNISKSSIKDLLDIKLDVFGDDRGFFTEMFNEDEIIQSEKDKNAKFLSELENQVYQ